MSIQYFHKQEKRRKHLYNPKGYLPFNSCSCPLDRWGWLSCLDCGDGYWSFGLGNRKGDPYPRGPRGCWLRQQVGTGGLLRAGHHPLCTVPSLIVSSISSLIHSPGIYWAPVGVEHHSSPSSEQSRQRFPHLWDSSGRSRQEMMSNRVGLMVINLGKRQGLGSGGLRVLRFPVGWSGRVLQRRDQKERFHSVTHVLLV